MDSWNKTKYYYRMYRTYISWSHFLPMLWQKCDSEIV